MILDGLKQFIKDYLYRYMPYTESDVYNALVTYLENVYFKDNYMVIPYYLRRIVDDNIIDFKLYDSYLLSFGIPREIVDKLTVKEKGTLLYIINDLNRLKASIEFVKRVSSELANYVAIYELYITRINSRWYFVPRLIYASQSILNTPEAIIKELFDYEEIYYKADYFYVTETELEYLYQQNQIILPIKTNLLLLDFFIGYNDTDITERLIQYICLSHLKDTVLNVNFFDTVGDKYTVNTIGESENFVIDTSVVRFTTTLADLISIYFYVYLKYYNAEFNVDPLYQPTVQINNDNAIIYTLDDIDEIEESYANIQTADDWEKFYNQYLAPFISYFIVQTGVVTYKDLRDAILNHNREFNQPILDYIDDRINYYYLVPPVTVYSSILDEIKNSLLTYVLNLNNEKLKKYLLSFVNNLPVIITPNIRDTAYFDILYTYKPFHTQFISLYRVQIMFNDKSNLLTPEDWFRQIINIEHSSLPVISDSNTLSILFSDKYRSTSGLPILSTTDKRILSIYNTDYIVDNRVDQIIDLKRYTFPIISDNIRSDILLNSNKTISNVTILSVADNRISINYSSACNIYDEVEIITS